MARWTKAMSINPSDIIRIAFDAHGSSRGRCAWDPLLILLARTDRFDALGFETVRGCAAADADSGENSFTSDPDGPHCYVIRQNPPEWYENEIDRMLL